MKMNGEHTLPVDRKTVWNALINPKILKDSIPGCTELEESTKNEFKAIVALKIGPVSAKFNSEVKLSNINLYKSYRISGQGKGGAAGFAKGGANITLDDHENGTILKYEVDAQIGGKIAQLASRLIDSTAKNLAGKFFDNFVKIVEGNEKVVKENL
tara:strand:- start:1152 stop:1619 length:468 start_codon:yes stop_codon:yes gene_type:complete